jgi:hypothetical protein
MAESQYPFDYVSPAEEALKAAFTEPRLGKFLVKGGYNFPLTMEWYLWNARLTKSLQFPMHVTEVTLRNALVEHLKLLGAPADWAFDSAFLSWLAGKSAGTRGSLNQSKERLLRSKLNALDFRTYVKGGSHLDLPAFGCINTDDVVAKLSFEFWTGLLDKEFESDWHVTLKKVFPNAPARTSRRDIWLLAASAKDLRNRMAHHEPIFHLPLEEEHNGMLTLIGMRCRNTKDWARHHSTFVATLAQEPKGIASASNDLSPFIRSVVVKADLAAPLSDVMPDLATKGSPGVLIDDGSSFKFLSSADIMKWLVASTEVGLANLEEPISTFLGSAKLTNRTVVVGDGLSTAAAAAMFYARNVQTKDKPTVLVVTEDGTRAGSLRGVVLKDDVRPARPS